MHEVVQTLDDALGRAGELLGRHTACRFGIRVRRGVVRVDQWRAVVGPDPVAEDPAWQRVLVESVSEAFRPGAEGWVDESMALSLEWDFDVADVQCSVTWWHGDHDANAPLPPVRRLIEHMDGVDLRVWENAGHLEPFHRHQEILAELLTR